MFRLSLGKLFNSLWFCITGRHPSQARVVIKQVDTYDVVVKATERTEFFSKVKADLNLKASFLVCSKLTLYNAKQSTAMLELCASNW